MSEDDSTPKPKRRAPRAKVSAPKDEAPATKPAPKKTGPIYFRSAEPEPLAFSIRERRAARRPDGRLEWRFSPEDAEKVRRHSHVVGGRVVEVK